MAALTADLGIKQEISQTKKNGKKPYTCATIQKG